MGGQEENSSPTIQGEKKISWKWTKKNNNIRRRLQVKSHQLCYLYAIGNNDRIRLVHARNGTACLLGHAQQTQVLKGAQRRWEKIRFVSASSRPRICANSCSKALWILKLSIAVGGVYNKQQGRLLFAREEAVVFCMQDSCILLLASFLFQHDSREMIFKCLCTCWGEEKNKKDKEILSNSSRKKVT